MQPLLQWNSNNYYIFWVCICSLSYPACNAHEPYCYLLPSPLYNNFPHYLINGTIFEKRIYRTQNVYFDFLYQLFSEVFLILKELSKTGKQMYIGLHIKYPLFLSDFNENWIFSTVVRKMLKYQISWNSVQWEPSCSMRTDWRTDRHDEAVSRFSQFCGSATKKIST